MVMTPWRQRSQGNLGWRDENLDLGVHGCDGFYGGRLGPRRPQRDPMIAAEEGGVVFFSRFYSFFFLLFSFFFSVS